MAEETKQATAPYGAFKTLKKNVMEGLLEGIPPRIDRSAFPGLAWNACTRLLGGMRFLGLINLDGSPTPALHALVVTDEAERKKQLGLLLRARYPELFKFDLKAVTPAHFAETLGVEYSAAGDTLEKAVRFFVAAASYAGIPMSRMLTDKARRQPAARRARPATATPAAKSKVIQPEVQINDGGASTRRTVALESGGSVTLLTAVNFLALTPADRQFVFELNDKLAAYEQEHPQQAEGEDDD